MEEINSKKTEAFLTAIKTLADEECKSIDEETDRLRVERLRALQKEAEDRYKSYTEYETARIKAPSPSVKKGQEKSLPIFAQSFAKRCLTRQVKKLTSIQKPILTAKSLFHRQKRLPRLLTAVMLSCFYAKRISCFPTISRRYLKTVVS